jgi:hypothetical protein
VKLIITKNSGDKVFGGKQMGKVIEMEVLNSVSQSYLTQLWSNDVFKRGGAQTKTITDTISRYYSCLARNCLARIWILVVLPTPHLMFSLHLLSPVLVL